jgi:diaminopropionate ammonia-lyase
MINKSDFLTHFANPKAKNSNIYTDVMRQIFNKEDAIQAEIDIHNWPNYKPTELHKLNDLAKHCRVSSIYYKDESTRFELKSFKSLGGSYAVAKQLIQYVKESTGQDISIQDLFSGRYADTICQVTITTATDGNHGRSVAWGAQMFGCGCVIYIHSDVSIGRENSMLKLGAEVVRIDGNYDDSVKETAVVAQANGWIIVSDNSYEGYLEIPKDVMLGYSVMLKEIVDQLDGSIPTHIFIQGGCGGLASTVCGYFWNVWGENRPRLVIVEPEQANCLQLSAQKGDLVVVDGKLDTLMAGLACGEVSLLAWDILETGTDDFTTVNESLVPVSMKLLAEGYGSDPKIEAGESAVAGIAGLLGTVGDNKMRELLGLTKESSVIVIGTEGATDPELYDNLIA